MITETTDGVVIDVHVQPGSRRSGLVGRHGAALKVAVTAPARDGAANEAVRRLLAELLGAGVGSVEVVRGVRSRAKRVRVTGVDPHQAWAAVERVLGHH